MGPRGPLGPTRHRHGAAGMPHPPPCGSPSVDRESVPQVASPRVRPRAVTAMSRLSACASQDPEAPGANHWYHTQRRERPMLRVIGLLLGLLTPAPVPALVEGTVNEPSRPAGLPRPAFFPVTVQFSPVPAGKGWKGEKPPLADQTLRDTVDNLLAHGFTGLLSSTRASGRPGEDGARVRAVAGHGHHAHLRRLRGLWAR